MVKFEPNDTLLHEGMLVFNHDGEGLPETVYVYGQGSMPADSLPDSAVIIDPSLGEGWQLISLPVTAAPGTCPPDFKPLYKYANGYAVDSIMISGSGYWYKNPSELSPLFVGYPIYQETVAVTKRWNIIGAPGAPVAVTDITSEPAGIVTSPFFGYDTAGYFQADTLEPGRAYWVKVTTNGDFFLAAS